MPRRRPELLPIHIMRTGSVSTIGTEQPVIRLWVLRILVCLKADRNLVQEHGFSKDSVAALLGMQDDDYQDARGCFIRKPALAALKAMHKEVEAKRNSLHVEGPVTTNAQNLARILNLDDVQREILEFTVLLHAVTELGAAADCMGELSTAQVRRALAVILARSEDDISKALAPDGALSECGLVTVSGLFTTELTSKLEILSDSFRDRMCLAAQDPLDLVKDTILASGHVELERDDYRHIDRQLGLLLDYLQAGLTARRPGMNIFIHGAPGTGKTQLARLVAKLVSSELYEIALGDNEDQHSNMAHQRLRSYKAAQRLFGQKPTLLMFDEAEDVFNDGDRFFGRKSTAQLRKAWMNRCLEQNPVPTLWLSNSVECMDPAFLRRFDMILELQVPPRQQRQRIVAKIGAERLTESSLTRLAASESLAPAVLSRAVNVVETLAEPMTPEQYSAAVEMLVDGTLKAQGHGGLARAAGDKLPTWYDARFINADADLQMVAAGLADSRAGRLCLFGPPGTGKSAFGRWLADQMGMPLLARKASDLVSPMLGETEQNLAAMFREAEAEKALLLVDEVDSFLQDRRNAVRSWEVSQVNELLTQMESFDGVFVASTNLMGNIDQAALRRFDIKVRFDYLKPAQSWEMLSLLCQDLGLPAPAAGLAAELARLPVLTPGDFALVARQHRFRKLTGPAQVIDALRTECAAKEDGRRQRIGFM